MQVCDESRTRDRNETGSSLDTNNIASEDRALVIARIDREEVLNDGARRNGGSSNVDLVRHRGPRKSYSKVK
jgi:hypothetical protein